MKFPGRFYRPQHSDLEDPVTAQLLEQPMTALQGRRGWVVVDEAQRQPALFPGLRVLADRVEQPATFLIFGSAIFARGAEDGRWPSPLPPARQRTVRTGLVGNLEPRHPPVWPPPCRPKDATRSLAPKARVLRSSFETTWIRNDVLKPRSGLGCLGECAGRAPRPTASPSRMGQIGAISWDHTTAVRPDCPAPPCSEPEAGVPMR